MTLGEIKVQSEDIVTVPEAAKQLCRTKMTLYRWIESGKIVAVKLGGILFVPKSEIERLNKENKAVECLSTALSREVRCYASPLVFIVALGKPPCQ